MWVRESNDPTPRKIDWIGQVTLTGALFLLVLALLRGNEEGWGSTAIVLELVGATLFYVAFLYRARRQNRSQAFRFVVGVNGEV